METKHTVRSRVRRIQYVALIVAVFALGFVLGNQYTISSAQTGAYSLPEDVVPVFEPLFQAYNLVEGQYLDMPDPEVLADGAIRGMIEALDDPYSNYVDPESFSFVSERLSGEYEGHHPG